MVQKMSCEFNNGVRSIPVTPDGLAKHQPRRRFKSSKYQTSQPHPHQRNRYKISFHRYKIPFTSTR